MMFSQKHNPEMYLILSKTIYGWNRGDQPIFSLKLNRIEQIQMVEMNNPNAYTFVPDNVLTIVDHLSSVWDQQTIMQKPGSWNHFN